MTASIIKIYYLYTAMALVQEGSRSFDQIYRLDRKDVVGGEGVLQLMSEGMPLTLMDLLHLMIDISDNTATNILFDLLGKEHINDTIKGIGIHNTYAARKLMKVIPGVWNYTTPEDAVLLLEALLGSEALAINYREKAIDILAKQQMNYKLSKDLWLCNSCGSLMNNDNTCSSCGTRDMEPEPVWFAHKTGEISTATHDVGIMRIGNREVIVALMLEQVKDMNTALDIHSHIGRLIYKYFTAE